MRFKLDENMPKEACQLLCDGGHDACTVLDQGLRGSRDEEVSSVCKREERVLLTLDSDFADIRVLPSQQPGVIVLSVKRQSKPTILGLVQRILPLLTTQPLAGYLWIVTQKTVRVRSCSSQGRDQ